MTLIPFCLAPAAGAAMQTEAPIEEEQVLRSLFGAYHPEKKTVEIAGRAEFIISCQVRETTFAQDPLIVAMAATSADPNARLHSFIETGEIQEQRGSLHLFVLQRQDKRLAVIARRTEAVPFSDASGFRINEIQLEAETFPISASEFAVGLTIVSTPMAAHDCKVLYLYTVDGGELREILQTEIGFSDRVDEYQARLSTPGSKTGGRFDILQKWYRRPIVSEDPRWQAEPKRDTLYRWNDKQRKYDWPAPALSAGK